MITVYVRKTDARIALDAPVTSGSIGMQVQFQFSDDWAELTKTAVFETNIYKETQQVPESGTVEIPPAVLAYPGYQLRIGVIGTSADGSTVIPTVYANCGSINPGASVVPVVTPLPPSQAEQLQAQIDELRENGSGGGLTANERSTLIAIVNAIGAFRDTNGKELVEAFNAAWGGSGEGGGTDEPDVPDTPDNPEVTLSGISATYSGGSVPAGTALNDLTGIVVTAHYSDGSTETVTGYTLSGTIAEGSNTVTVTYQGMTTTITVTGTVVVVYTVTNNLTNVTNSNAQTEVTEGFYSAMLTAADGYLMQSVVITMGGVDITADVYTAETGSILITEVTGDIVITALAVEPKEISMSESTSQYISVYSDNGSTKLTTAYFDYFVTDNKTESDASVTVEITNSGDSACSGDVYIGCDKVNYAIKKTISLAAGDSVRYGYTVKGGCALGVCVPNASAITVRVYGVFDVYQPTAEFAVTSTQVTTVKTYSDGTTDNLLKSANYQYVVRTTETFAEDTDLIVTIVGGEADATISGTEWYFGSVDPANLATIYYGVQAGRANTKVKVGQVVKNTYTVKAGYAFAIANVMNTLTADMVYVEKA